MAYGDVGGVLYHSPEEQQFAEGVLGLNHPRGGEVGTLIAVGEGPPAAARGLTGRHLVYCGRYSRQKNVPLVLEFFERYQRERPGRFGLVFAGQGEVRIPKMASISDRGRVTEEEKRRLLAGADALLQLSTQESLSLVALEAWAAGTPVIAHERCAVLRGQIARAGGGRTIGNYEEFAQRSTTCGQRPDAWRDLGAHGHAYVKERYGDEDAFRGRLLEAIASLRVPLGEQMRRRGLQRGAERARPRWRERFGQVIERVLDEARALLVGTSKCSRRHRCVAPARPAGPSSCRCAWSITAPCRP